MGRTTAILRADAIFDLVAGALLLMSTWEGLFRALDLPRAEPELWTQIAGGLLLAFGYLLWIAPRDVRLTQAVSATAAVANALGVIVIVVWLLVGDLAIGGLGTALLLVLAGILAFFAAAEAVIASRSIAMLMAPD